MNDKSTRYMTTIFTLDGIMQSTGITTWNKNDFYNFVKEQEKNKGLKLISLKEEILVIVEYNNIIWNYTIYYGSYKKKYKSLIKDDERWENLENIVKNDLKMIGLDELTEEILINLKSKKYFEYKIKIEKQFKKYCV